MDVEKTKYLLLQIKRQPETHHLMASRTGPESCVIMCKLGG